MKPPLIFHSRAYQTDLILNGTREKIIEWLVWNDPNGTYTDPDSALEGLQPLTREAACGIMRRQTEDSEASRPR